MTESYQSIISALPRFLLSALPSPLQRAERLETSLRSDGCRSVPRIYVKRDDLLSLALGGNKTRNLEFLIGDALARGATDVVTAGRQQSNHCRLTAAACARAGLRSHLVLSGSAPEQYRGNLLLDRLLGAEVIFTGSEDRLLRSRAIEAAAEGIERRGRLPYIIPVGGSDTRGAFGHVLAAGEISRQCERILEPAFTVVLATATGGTQAGLIVGFEALGLRVPVLGFAVAKSPEELTSDVQAIVESLRDELRHPQDETTSIDIDGTAIGTGYGEPTVEGNRAVEKLARLEGILTDPVYTGKALAGLFSMIAEDQFSTTDAVVFIHTGGVPALFA